MRLAAGFVVRLVPVLLFVSLLSGCGGGSPVGPPPNQGASSVYVLQQGDPYAANATLSYALQFSTGATGSATPVSSLALPTAFVAYSIALDSAGRIYVGGYQGSLSTGLRVAEILMYAAHASGTPEPLLTMLPQSGGLPVSMAVDSAGQLYVANSRPDSLAVYASAVNGPAMPSRQIEGALTEINTLESLAVDAAGNVYATTQTGAATPSGLLLIFSPASDGNVAPTRVITSDAGMFFYGVAVDSGLNVYATEEAAAGADGAIVEYAAGASGNAMPIRSIAGSATTMGFPGGLRRDNAGTLYTVNEVATSTSVSFSVLGFNASASGNSQPSLAFSSAAWTAAAPEVALQ